MCSFYKLNISFNLKVNLTAETNFVVRLPLACGRTSQSGHISLLSHGRPGLAARRVTDGAASLAGAICKSGYHMARCPVLLRFVYCLRLHLRMSILSRDITVTYFNRKGYSWFQYLNFQFQFSVWVVLRMLRVHKMSSLRDPRLSKANLFLLQGMFFLLFKERIIAWIVSPSSYFRKQHLFTITTKTKQQQQQETSIYF